MTINPQLEIYSQLVRDYSKVLDLSSPKMLQEFTIGIERSQTFIPAIPEKARVLDIGSGVGLPAIPIAILRPDIQITLCEIRQKRAAFLERSVSQLKLNHATVFQGDVRKLEQTFDCITALWVGNLEQLYTLAKHCLAPTWSIITRKGNDASIELELFLEKHPDINGTIQLLDDGANLVILRGGN